MKEIEFKGKRVDNGEWAYGDLIHGVKSKIGNLYILPENIDQPGCHHLDGFEVIIKSVGMFTGFLALKRKTTVEERVYEGDVFRFTETQENDDITTYYVVMYIEQRAAFFMVPHVHYEVIIQNNVSNEPEFSWLFDEPALYEFSLAVEQCTKIGNYHDMSYEDFK